MHLEYPRCLYKAGDQTLIVQDDAQKAAALKAGWRLKPVPEKPADSKDDPTPAAE